MPWWTWPAGVLAAVGAAWMSVGLVARFLGILRQRSGPATAPAGLPPAAPVLATEGIPASERPSSPQEDPDPQNKQFEPKNPQQPQESMLKFLALRLGFVLLLSAVVLGALFAYGWRQFPPDTRHHVPGGDPDRGRALIIAYGCGACHTIPGINSATGKVGPSLEDFPDRMYIGGQLPNLPEHLIPWIRNPQHFAPGTAMPNLAVTTPEARDMAAYLYQQ